ncbi:MAG: RHS repeat-associated core domain-containing protein [Bryobacteraceae bacterium]
MTAAKEQTAPVFFLAAGLRPLFAENSCQGHPIPKTTMHPAWSFATSTSQQACAFWYDGTASGRLVGSDYFGARYFSSAQGRFTSVDPIWVTMERLMDPQRLNLYSYARNNPLRFIDPDGMDITLGRCAEGAAQSCFNEVLAGLKKEDRSHVHLVQGDGKNGFKKGQNGVTVDAGYKSDSANFQTLQKLAGDHTATAVIEVLKPTDKFDVQSQSASTPRQDRSWEP